jgi:predicted metal-dependent peptidase
VFEYIDQMPEPPDCVVCLTDLYSQFPSRAPDVPVLWAVIANADPKAPFGRVVNVKA